MKMTHALKMKRQMVRAVLLNQLEPLNMTLESANSVLSDVEKLDLACAFAALAKKVQKIGSP